MRREKYFLLCGAIFASCFGTATSTPSPPQLPTTPTPQACEDDGVGGLPCSSFPHVCQAPLGQQLCRKTCATCSSPNPAAPDAEDEPASENCEISDNVQCATLPNVCQNSQLSHLLCPHLCGYCQVSDTTTTTTTTTTTASTTPIVETCVDSVGEGLTCAELPGVCNNDLGRLLCMRSCKLCAPNPHAIAPSIPSTSASLLIGQCVDHVIGKYSCSQLPQVCQAPLGKALCPRLCGACVSDTTTTTPTPLVETCVDSVGEGLTCAELPGVCNNDYGRLLCMRSCKLCAPNPHAIAPSIPSTSASFVIGQCVDHVTGKYSCSELPGVCQVPVGKALCPRLCGACVSVTSHTPPSTTPSPMTETCLDHLGEGITCKVVPGMCGSAYAPLLCRRFCGLCVPNPHAVTSSPSTPSAGGSANRCVDHVIGGLTCAQVPDMCHDQLGQILCPQLCGFCANNSTSEATTPMTTSTTTPITSPTITRTTTATTHTTTLTTHTTTPATHTTHPTHHATHPTHHATHPTHHATTPTTHITTPTTHTTTPTTHTTTPTTHNTTPTTHTTTLITILTTTKFQPASTTGVTGSSVNSGLWSTSPAQPQSSGPCRDLVGLGLSCDTLAGACDDPLADVVCRKTCRFCVCQDHLVGTTCADIIASKGRSTCQDDLGKTVCAKTCGLC